MGILFAIIVIIILAILFSKGSAESCPLSNAEHLKIGSSVVKVHPYTRGSKQYKHWEVSVEFADGSWYCTAFGDRHLTTITYNKQQLDEAVQKAIAVHEEWAKKANS